MSAARRLVLASGSPRRREILTGMGFEFEVRAVEVDESRRSGEAPLAYVRRLAREKARASRQTHPEAGDVFLGADTIVVLGDELLGKPADPEDAVSMLLRLAGREHRVSTGIAVLDTQDRIAVATDTTRVRFLPLVPAEIRRYVATGEPMDKAGAYAIQGLGGRFVESIDGSFTNVVGLPVATVRRLLATGSR